MKRCTKCGHECEDSARFCERCGAALDTGKKCPGCGSMLSPAARFCPVCGTNVQNAQPAPAAVPAAFPAGLSAGLPAAEYAPVQQDVQPDDIGTKGNRTAGILKFLPAVLLIIFSLACFLAFMLGTGYSFSFGSDTCAVSFFNTLSDPDAFDLYFGLPDGNTTAFGGILLIFVAFLSLIIGAAGFGKAARSRAGKAWTRNYRVTFVWGIIMYILAAVAALAYMGAASARADVLEDTGYYSSIIMSAGSVPVFIIVSAAICIVASIVAGAIKGAAKRTYGNLDTLQAAREKKTVASHGVRTGFCWTIIGKSLLLFVFAILLLVFFRMNLFAAGMTGNADTSLYALLFDDTSDMYGMRMAMFVLLICAALCLIFGFISLMRDLAKRKRIYTTSTQDKGSVKWSLFMIFLYCLVLAAIGYACGRLDANGYSFVEAEMAENGYHIMGSLMTSIQTLTIVCLAIHVVALIAQCTLFNVFSFDAAPMGHEPTAPAAEPFSGTGNGNGWQAR